MSTKTKTERYEDATLLLNEGSLEAKMERRQTRRSFHRGAVAATAVLGLPLLFSWGVSVVSPNFNEAVNENTKLEIAFWVDVVITFVVFMLALLSKPWSSKKGTEKEFMDRISKLLRDKTLDGRFNSELARLAPVMQEFSRQVLKENPALARRLTQNPLGRGDSEEVARLMVEYFLARPKDALKFANVLTVAGVPQNVIDLFYAKCVPDTLSFNMAQKLAKGKDLGK